MLSKVIIIRILVSISSEKLFKDIVLRKNFNTYSLDHFVRHQRVSECWRNVDGQWKLIPIEFERGRQADSNGYCKSLAGIFGCYVQASAEEKTA